MNLPSNTPENGDFVQYLEQLTNAKANANSRISAWKNEGESTLSKSVHVQPVTTLASTTPSYKQPLALKPFAGIPFFSHVRWAVFLWIATQALSRVFWWAHFAFTPALIIYAVWIIYKVNQNTNGSLLAPVFAYGKQVSAETIKRVQAGKSSNQ